jgi:Putative bacterial sensory transduction regulator
LSERAPVRDDGAVARLDAVVREWAELWRASGQVGEVEHRDEPDPRGHYHWLVRVRGAEKQYVTIWLALRQRTVHVETEVTPAPEENLEQLYRFLLTRNADLREVHLAIGPEAGIYLVAAVPVGELDVARLDELVGASVTYLDEIYPTAMSLGLPSLYRRRAP